MLSTVNKNKCHNVGTVLNSKLKIIGDTIDLPKTEMITNVACSLIHRGDTLSAKVTVVVFKSLAMVAYM